ncbi:MAG: hypothetical protein R2825_19200 [Saprospiraceae bacterium]
MMRLVHIYCPCMQNVSIFAEAFLKHFNTARFFSGHLLKHTYSLLLFAAFSLIPIVVNGQCNELICNQNVEVKLDADCLGSANPYYMLANYWSCTGPATVEYFDANGTPMPNNEVNGSHIGQTVSVHITHDWSGHDCWGTIKVVDKRKPTIEIDNVTLNCTEDTSVSAVGEPTVYDNCSNNVIVSYADSILDFGCGYTGFAGYFDPSNWEVCLNNYGDGGVDVTGAPDQILVEGADSSPLSTSPTYVTRFKIVIPTEGFVSFDWSSFGGSSFNPQGFYLTINNWCIQLTNDSIQSGSYTTGLLFPGDVLSFEQVSDGDADAVHTFVSNFNFNTLAWKVINRTWSATDEYGNTRLYTQVITQNRASLSQVIFPYDRDGIAAPMLTCGAMADLSLTGQPYIDEDGDLNTSNDQYALDNGECAFSVIYEDQNIATCEGSELVLRKWTIVDDCSGQVLEHSQIIKLFDITPPTINCPPAQVVGTNNLGCFSNLTLPQATAFDDCSSIVNISPNWNFGVGYGPFGNIAPGTYAVTYEATDDCGNLNTCETTVTVEDAIGPTVICDGQTIASLDSDGNAMVYADVVDDGSYDWCCIESFMIKKEGAPDTEYALTLPIDCSDLGDPVMVTLKVTDCAGNFNTCNVDVIVQDNDAPVILPPADLTVDCTTDLSDLSIFGNAIVFDNCGYALDATYYENFTGCGKGAIVRSWTATDAYGNVTTAEQNITLDNLAPWNISGNNIVWPENYTTTGCNISLEPYDLPAPFDGPILFGQNGCESVSVSHTDDYYWIAEPSCYSVHRHWKITDWCQFEPNSGNNTGVWEYTQVIEIQDVEAPVFINPPADIVIQGANGCFGNVVLPLPEMADCSNHITVVATGDLGSGFNFQNVPAGTYQMTYFAEDGCGNGASHTIQISIGDDEAPMANCLNGLTVNLGNSGIATVFAETFDSGSSDNCSTDLQFSFTQNPGDDFAIFDCDDEGQSLIDIFVFDDGGNMATCQTFVMIVDNQQVCLQPPVMVAGLVQNPQGLMVAGTEVELSGVSTPPFMTNNNGEFSFENLPSGNNYTLTPSKLTNYLNGVTAYDLSKINAHILGVELFQKAWQVIAADANNSQSLTTYDIVALQNLILHNITTLPNGTPSWQFVPADHVFTNPYIPWPFPADISMNNLTGDYLTADFLGIKVGDVTGNADPSMFDNGNEDRSGGVFSIITEDQQAAAGETMEVSFEMEEALAYQFTLFFDPAKMSFVEMTEGNVAIGATYQEQGQLTIIWYGKGEKDFTLKFDILQNTDLSEALTITSSKTPAIAWDQQESALNIELNFTAPDQPPLVSQHLALFQNQPNPFSSATTIRFQLPEPTEVQFDFFDSTGRLLFSKKAFFEMGIQQMKIRKEDLQQSGLVFYELQTETDAVVGKMIVD